MKKIKKLTLNKEVVSILGGNDMNLVKGGTQFVDGSYPCGGTDCCCNASFMAVSCLPGPAVDTGVHTGGNPGGDTGRNSLVTCLPIGLSYKTDCAYGTTCGGYIGC